MNMAAQRLRLFGVFALLFWVGLVGACRRNQTGVATERPPAPVIVAVAEQRDVPDQIRAIGNVEPLQIVQVRSQVSGQIERIFFKEGDDVTKGQPLFELDKRPFVADLEKAIGQLQRDQAQAENSRVQAGRYTDLERQGIISHEQAEQFRAQAKADAAAVDSDRAAVAAARLQLQYTEIKSPLDARAGALLINVGNLVKANDTPYLVQLNQVAPIYVTFSVPEEKLSQLRQLFASGELRVSASRKGQPEPSEGRLTFVDNGVDTSTGMFKLKATFENRDKRLWPGEFVDVALVLSIKKDVLVVPTKAVQSGQQGDYVYVVTENSTAEPRAVKVAGTDQDVTLISAGVRPGERVITDGQLRVAPNAKVAVQNAPGGSAKNKNAGTMQSGQP